MAYEQQSIAQALKSSRENKGLSQRALSSLTGVLQTRISKIENGATDFRITTLVALARALDLELALVPRKAVSAVQSVVRASEPRPALSQSTQALKELERLKHTLESFGDTAKGTEEYAQFQRQLRDLHHLQLGKTHRNALKEAASALKTFQRNPERKDVFRRALADIRALRNALAHAPVNLPQPTTVKPAYSLDEEQEEGNDG